MVARDCLVSFLGRSVMLTILRVEELAKCAFCSREKEVAAVLMDGSKTEVLLCWADVRKHAAMRMRMNGQSPKPAPVAVPAK